MKIMPGFIHWEKWFWHRIFEDRFTNLVFAFFQPWLVYLGDNRDSMSMVEELAMSLNTAGYNLLQHRIPLPQQRAVCQVFSQLFSLPLSKTFLCDLCDWLFHQGCWSWLPTDLEGFQEPIDHPRVPQLLQHPTWHLRRLQGKSVKLLQNLIWLRLQKIDSGNVASYIPQLAK